MADSSIDLLVNGYSVQGTPQNIALVLAESHPSCATTDANVPPSSAQDLEDGRAESDKSTEHVAIPPKPSTTQSKTANPKSMPEQACARLPEPLAHHPRVLHNTSEPLNREEVLKLLKSQCYIASSYTEEQEFSDQSDDDNDEPAQAVSTNKYVAYCSRPQRRTCTVA